MGSVYSVTQINSYIKNMFAQDYLLNRVQVRGEVSNCKYHSSGHIYFTLKDSGGTLSCIMFAGNRRGLSFGLKEGQSVVAEGTVTVYERDGKFQLYARSITLDGIGALYQRFEELKCRLEEMGVFAEEYKQPVPKYAKRVGIVTSRTGAAIQDIINITARRNPYVQLVLYPALVQGAGAKESIVRGIETLDKEGVDVIIVGRGGGSIEDLWAFNEECVAMAVFNCRTPIISAVGHETDFTITDFAADMRAPTPSAAAELAVYDYRAFEGELSRYRKLLLAAVDSEYERTYERLKRYSLKLSHYNPRQQLIQKQQRLADTEDALSRSMHAAFEQRQGQLALLSERLNGLSPLRQLMRGYAYVTDGSGHAVTSVRSVSGDDTLNIELADGRLSARVVSKSRNNKYADSSMERSGYEKGTDY